MFLPTGLAATPPAASQGLKLMPGSMKRVGSSQQFKGKFWNHSNSSNSTSENKFALRAAKPHAAATSSYWAKTFLDEQTRKWEHLLDFDARCGPAGGFLTHCDTTTGSSLDKAVLFVQMQLCEKTLRCWLDERGAAISHFKNVQIFRQILLGVEYIHSQNIIHR